MDNTEMLGTLLVSVGYRLPMIIALGIAIVMMLDTPVGRPRSAVLWALSILLVCALVGGGLSILPLLLVAQGSYGMLRGMSALLSALNITLSLVQAGGFILLAWGVVQALRSTVPGRKA